MKKLSDICFRGWTSWLLPLLLLLTSILLFEVTDWDMAIQRHFYSPENGWLIHFKRYSGAGLFYYTLLDAAVGAFAACLLAFTLWNRFAKHKVCWRCLYLLACLAAIPCAVAVLKNLNSMPYPSKIQEFGGTRQRRSLVQAFHARWVPGEKHYRGWPAGHASGACSLIALAFVFEKPRRRWLGFAVAAAATAIAGLGHTMDGNHFFSHNLVSFFLAWLIAAWIYGLMKAKTGGEQ